MSENSLCNAVENLITLHRLSSYQGRKFLELFSRLEVGDLVYAGMFKSKLNISIEEAYYLLDELKSQGFLIHWYEIYCYDCNKSTGIFIDTPRKFNPDLCCDYCGKHLTMEENLIVLYKVMRV